MPCLHVCVCGEGEWCFGGVQMKGACRTMLCVFAQRCVLCLLPASSLFMFSSLAVMKDVCTYKPTPSSTDLSNQGC